MQLLPVNNAWCHIYILEPYAEGMEYMNLFWEGVDRSLEHKPIPLTDRIVCLLKGALLTFPLINTIIWLAWKALGNPVTLSDPHCPDSHSSSMDTSEQMLPSALPQTNSLSPTGRTPNSFESFGFMEKIGADRPFPIDWRLERFPDIITASQQAPTYSTFSIYDLDFNLRELRYQMGNKKIDLVRSNAAGHDQVSVQITEGQNTPATTIVELPRDGKPLIQQRHLGFRPFVLSDATELEFYGLIPEFPALGWLLSWMDSTPFLLLCKATKKGVEGGLMKVELTPMRGWPYNTAKSELWFHPRTGVLTKFKDAGTFIATKEGTIVQNNRILGPAHP